jgi:thiamine-phosphate pyrophosphorylase
MVNDTRLRGLYAITGRQLAAAGDLAWQVEQALLGGARIVQYRDKGSDYQRRRTEAQALLRCCRRHSAPLIINDDVELAAEIGADGVHLGSEDTEPAAARRRLGPNALIGLSCYNDLKRALAAQEAGADYVAFGSFFSSPTKPAAAPADLGLLYRARQQLTVPIVAIGGINADNGAQLVWAGADMLAVISGVFGQPDIAAAAEKISRLFD